MNDKMTCYNCKTAMDSSLTQCPHCGVPIISQPVNQSYAPYQPYAQNQQPYVPYQPQGVNQPYADRKKRSNVGNVLGIVFGSIGGLFILLILIAIFSDNSDSPNTLNATASPAITDNTIADTSSPSVDTASSPDEPLQEQPQETFENQPSNVIDIPDGGIIMFDEEDIVVAVTEVKRDRHGYVSEIEFTISNNGENEINISSMQGWAMVVQINNLTIQSIIDATVMPGKKAVDSIRIDDNEAELFDLKNVYSIKAQFQIDITYEPSEVIISEGEHGSDFLNNGQLVFTSDYADVYSFGFRESWITNYADFVVHNKQDHDVKFRFHNMSIDGIMDSGLGTLEEVFANTYRIFSVTVDDINVSEIEFTLREEEFGSIISDKERDLGLVTVNYE